MKQKFISTTLAFSMIIVSFTTQTSCDTKCKTKLLADLLFTVAQVTVPQIAVGSSFIINNVLTNLAQECEAEQAAASEKGIRTKYKPNENSAFADAQLSVNGNATYEVIVPSSALASNQSQNINDSFRFRTPGIYRFYYEADRYGKVSELNEFNNSTGSNNGTIKSIGIEQQNGKYQLTVEVYDPTGNAKPNYDYQTNPTVLQYLGSK